MLKIKNHTRVDLKYRIKWLNNPKVNKYLGDDHIKGTTLKKEKEWFNNYEKDKNKKFFTIYIDKQPIGLMGLSNIDKSNRRADLFIAIGEDDYRGKGYGRPAILWLINYGFNKLKLHKINLGVTEENVPAVKLYKKVGFKVEGRFKDEDFFDNTYHDSLSMAIFNKSEA